MTKREMIDEILAINLSAQPQFLARFGDEQLQDYLTHLQVLSTPRLRGEPGRYDKYFRDLPKIAAPRAPWRTEEPAEDQASTEADTEADDEQRHAEALAALDGAACDDDQAVGPEERQQLLDASAVVDETDDQADEAEMPAAFQLTPTSPVRASSSRPAASAAARQMLFGAGDTQKPPRRRKRAPKRRAQAAG